MPDVLIRNIDQETLDSFKSKAELNGRSLNEELKQLLERNRPFTPEERVAASRRLRAMSGGPRAANARRDPPRPRGNGIRLSRPQRRHDPWDNF